MLYPLTSLLRFTETCLLANDFSNVRDRSIITRAQHEYTKLAYTARFEICTYIGTAATDQQAAFMIHALKVALLNLQNNLEQHKIRAQDEAQIAVLFDLAINEIDKLQQFLAENFDQFAVFPVPRFNTKQQEAKDLLQTGLSVPQLGLLLRLFVETGILDERSNVSAVIKKFSSVFKTKKTTGISPDSLRIKYYAPEKAAVNIKEYLLRMMQLLREY